MKLTAECACSDLFEDYVGQLQMATIASIQVEHGRNAEINRRDISDKLRPIQEVKHSHSHHYSMSCRPAILSESLGSMHKRDWKCQHRRCSNAP